MSSADPMKWLESLSNVLQLLNIAELFNCEAINKEVSAVILEVYSQVCATCCGNGGARE